MSFSDDIKNFKDKAQHRTTEIIRGSILELFGMVVLATPVGNPIGWKSPAPKGYVGGRLRGNWNINIGQIDRTTSTSTDKNGSRTTMKATAKMGRFDGSQPVYISNHLPYAQRVENGWSKQRPHGMMRVSVNEWRRIVQGNA